MTAPPNDEEFMRASGLRRRALEVAEWRDLPVLAVRRPLLWL